MTTRTSHPSLWSAFGRAPITSPRPPVFAHGPHSDATMRTFSGAGGAPGAPSSGGVVTGFDLPHPPLRHLPRLELVVDAIEAEKVLVHAPGGVGHRGAGAHDERPVARLHEHELAGRLVERAADEPVRRG